MRYLKLSLLLFVFTALLVPSPVQAQENDVQSQAIKFGRVLRLIQTFYVDTTNLKSLTEDAIRKVLSDLDPHSVYISAKEVEEMNEPLQGNFEGIGISFNIHQDTLMVLTTIPGGPSEKVGLRPGDRIVTVDGKNIAGIGLTNQNVFDMLRGDKGTKVNLQIKRKGEKNLLDFTIVRDKIPIHSLDAAYMLDKNIAYVKLNRFAATTPDEFLKAMDNLQNKNKVEGLVLDLRGNGGGYLRAAIDLADQFLPNHRLVVYTKGIHSPKREYFATGSGDFENGKVVILVDEGSASASEIVTGAIQDWDRGVVIGRRTFGKGLVQQPFMLSDGSMIRLTTAHYYTPSGRNIQKPYSKGIKEYRNDYLERFEHGEFFSRDSINLPDSLLTHTLVTKRKVYGGGGIMPDIFVPMDTSVNYRYYNELVRKNVLFPFVVGYMDKNRGELLKQYKTFDAFNKDYAVSDAMYQKLVAKGDEEGIKPEKENPEVSENLLKQQIKALIARDLYDNGTYFQIMNEDDKAIKKAIEVLSDSKLYDKYLGR
ncbi:S41 family peptidase [Prolixibacter denitrificans]|uniref:Carboxyl-terminal processing protease n=1 Tax=Prolixibacter denitrificans TaxID=1541063 RepID=A0A2P8C9V8_9BACT|nr:S41 family peptidase [Prolixibacter denitrificans]PSK81757.1 carboxyl-terminal processing protease [Prolixibacter denitrificans]GET21278.1 peptidase S41 [Prolixibacter denitrificans]